MQRLFKHPENKLTNSRRLIILDGLLFEELLVKDFTYGLHGAGLC